MATLKNLTINDTGYLQLPTGTTAQRPVSPTVGMVRFNTDTKTVETYTSAGWVATDDQQTATGGTITAAGGYTIHTFTTGGTFTPTYTGPVDVLVVAGGGGGAAGIGGGGGAGGLIYNQGIMVSGGTGYAVTIGPGGGATGTGHGPDGNKGSDSSAFGITATGGGGGAGYYATHQNSNQIGGSGGGGPGYGTASGPWGGNSGFRPGPPGTAGQGHPGGFGYHGNPHGGGGGGGAGEPGYCRGGNNPTSQIDTGPGAWNATNESGAQYQLTGNASGGNGLGSAITGITPVYYAGGGGGGVHSAGSYGFGRTSGGLGGGGHSPGSSPGNGNPATYYGGGGGAGNHPDPSSGGSGYQGIVIVRYKSS